MRIVSRRLMIFLETKAWDAAQQALFDALRAAFLAGWAAAGGKKQGGRLHLLKPEENRPEK